MTHEIGRKSLVDIEESTPQGAQELAAARLSITAVALLNEALESASMTPTQLAQAMGVSIGRVSQLLNGTGNIRLTTLARYMRVMNYQVNLTATSVNPAEQPQLPRRRKPRRRRQRPVEQIEAVQWVMKDHQDREYNQIVIKPANVSAHSEVVYKRTLGMIDVESAHLEIAPTAWKNESVER